MRYISYLLLCCFILGTRPDVLVGQSTFTDSTANIVPGRKIIAGDKLKIVVYGHEDFPSEVIVEADGTIKYPFMKGIKIDGLSIEQMSSILASRLSQFLAGRIEVVVSFVVQQLIDVVILGQIDKPGAHRIPVNHTIQGAIWTAGATSRSDLNNIKLLRTNRETGLIDETIVELEDLILRRGEIKNFPALQSGDVIFVPTLFGATYVNVIGAVERAGNYQIFPGANVVDVIFLAGGPKGQASLRAVKLIRRVGMTPVETIVNVESVLKAEASDIPQLAPGDIVFVPSRKFTLSQFFTILGYFSSIMTFALLWITLQLRSQGVK